MEKEPFAVVVAQAKGRIAELIRTSLLLSRLFLSLSLFFFSLVLMGPLVLLFIFPFVVTMSIVCGVAILLAFIHYPSAALLASIFKLREDYPNDSSGIATASELILGCLVLGLTVFITMENIEFYGMLSEKNKLLGYALVAAEEVYFFLFVGFIAKSARDPG